MSAFGTLAASDQSLFARCGEPIGKRLCSDATDAASQAACLDSHAAVFADQPTRGARRRWLAANGCPASTIDGTGAPAVAVTPAPDPAPETEEKSPQAAADAPPAQPDPVPPADAPAALPATATPTGNAPATPAAPVTAERASAMTAPPGPAERASATTVAQPAAAAAAAPAPAGVDPLKATGASCRRSAECESDLCVRGRCGTFTLLAAAQACANEVPSPSAAPVGAAKPAPPAPPAEPPVPPAERARPAERAPQTQAVLALARPPGPLPPSPSEPQAPRLESGGARHQQLRDSILAHEPEMKRCVDRQLKLVPTLRAEGTLVIDVDAHGRVPRAALRGSQLEGTPLETCLRDAALRWRFPPSGRAYAVEAPLRVTGKEATSRH